MAQLSKVLKRVRWASASSFSPSVPAVAGCLFVRTAAYMHLIQGRGKQVGSMNEESQVRGCYNITFICTKQETV